CPGLPVTAAEFTRIPAAGSAAPGMNCRSATAWPALLPRPLLNCHFSRESCCPSRGLEVRVLGTGCNFRQAGSRALRSAGRRTSAPASCCGASLHGAVSHRFDLSVVCCSSVAPRQRCAKTARTASDERGSGVLREEDPSDPGAPLLRVPLGRS